MTWLDAVLIVALLVGCWRIVCKEQR